MKIQITLFSIFLFSFFGNAQSIEKFSIDSGGASEANGNIQILYTLGEVNVQELSAGNIQISEGFITSVSLQLSINPKVFLQGPLLAPTTPSLMNDDLRIATVIPTTSPYPDGLTCNASVFTPTGPNAIVDWVFVELRNASDRTNVIEARSALLQRDGDVVDVDGTSAVSFTSAAASYYVLVNHRNHLGVLSANPIAILGTTAVDLSSNPSDVFGGTNAVANMGGGNYAMFGGDVNGNGQVQNSDLTAIVLLLGSSGYSEGDLNLNGQVQNSDINNTGNPNLGKGEQY
ncbi:hypothetical protein [Cochleicola gelatinilyticus]|uniref:Dockerin domain-containing protein n=1 Tax=Cochleicola gelatinilyticus TaxID=1763537 RepID=A0A167HJX4_9FLAO|nr:hypothetical protein [Cochleicola gelatinilyticus]OAB78688.1 hypothetical protein ULVI_08890 [Cochleicola gelatinilyticus]